MKDNRKSEKVAKKGGWKAETRKCAVCGKTFVPNSVNQRYCSEKCKVVQKRRAEKSREKCANKPCVVKTAKIAKHAVKPTDKNRKNASSPAKSAKNASRNAQVRLPKIRNGYAVQRVVMSGRSSSIARVMVALIDLASAVAEAVETV